jgi:hypothetical protein
MAKELPFSGVMCDEKERKCKIWWLATIKDKTCTVEVEVPIIAKHPELTERMAREIEIRLEDDFKDSIAKTEGVCDID